MSKTRTLHGTILAFLAIVAASSFATTSITVDSVVQRWPWNNKVDITYTVTDGQSLSSNTNEDVYCRIVFTATIAGATYEIDGVTNVGASANSGTHTVTWTPPADLVVKATDCTMSATLLSATNPSGDDYLIVDLDSGAVSFEGLLHSQDLSNSRYNTVAYKSDKIALRKVPAWAKRTALPNGSSLTGGGYRTGHSAYNSLSTHTTDSTMKIVWQNPPTNWVTRSDFYIGVFPVTQEQYRKLYGTLPNWCAFTSETYSPVNMVSWDDLRVAGTAPDAALPAVSAPGTGTFLQRLNFITGNRFPFDLPTVVMSEIAARAGATTVYWWGDTADNAYAWNLNNSPSTQQNVGGKPANPWGLYDVCGNGYEWCLDDESRSNLASASTPFSPASGSGDYRITRNGGGKGSALDTEFHRASQMYLYSRSLRQNNIGFRVAVVVK